MTITTSRLSSALLLTALLVAPLLPARATTVTDMQILDQFNVVTFGNFSSTSDVEGRTVVGGNLTNGATFELNSTGVASSSFASLTVYGNISAGNSENIDNGGGLAVGGSNNANFSINGSGTAYIAGSNSGNLSFSSGNDSVTVVGANSGQLTVPSGSIYVGGNSGVVSTSGATTIAINGNNTANMNLNGTTQLQLNGSNTATIGMSGGSYTYTGSEGQVNLNGGATATHASSLSLSPPASTLGNFASTFQTPLTQLSTQLAGLTANSTTSGTSGTIAFNAAPNSSGVAVFNVSSSIFAANSTITLNLDGATSVIINVTVSGCVSSTSCVLTMPSSLNFTSPTGYAETVLWNFVNATGLNFSTEFGGTVLAPDAAVTASNSIDGSVVAESVTTTGEIHNYPYAGTLPDGTVTVTGSSTAAPEPASLTVIGSGMAALGWVKRRRKGKRRAPLNRL